MGRTLMLALGLVGCASSAQLSTLAPGARAPILENGEELERSVDAYAHERQARNGWPSQMVGTAVTVRVSVLVPIDGLRGRVEVLESSGFPSIDRSALGIAHRARFSPAMDVNGEPIEVWFPLSFTFRPWR